MIDCCLTFGLMFRNPWILLATEFFEGFSGYLPIVAGSYYCAAESPPGMLAALNGIVYGAIYGIGIINGRFSRNVERRLEI